MKRVMSTVLVVLSVVFATAVLMRFAPAKTNASVPKTEGDTTNVTIKVNFEEPLSDQKSEVVVEQPSDVVLEEATDEILSDTDKILLMLSQNYCYNLNPEDLETLVACATVTLFDLAIEDEVGEFTISSALVADFIKSFYGLDITDEQLDAFCTEPNRVKVAEVECGVFEHKLISLTEQNGIFVAVTCMTSYYGGNEVETNLVKAKFVKNVDSYYGFNMIYCEIPQSISVVEAIGKEQ